MMSKELVLLLTVKNVLELESGFSREYCFNQDGGSIGSGANNHWVIQDTKKNIPINQAHIEWRDGSYCLQVINKPLFINGASFTPKSGFIKLANEDQIKFGSLKVLVTVAEKSAITSGNYSKSLEDIVTGSQDHLDDILKAKKGGLDLSVETKNIDDSIIHDPLRITSRGSSNMDQSYIDLPMIENEEKQLSPFSENAYVTISPLMREMDTKIELLDTQETHDFLQEVGKTLKATIEGLLALQKEQSSLSDKHLRPIEDNPLRLNLDYESTIDVLFGDQKSPVHLAAPAAVKESLHNLLIHNEANRIAIISALKAILDAFSPDVLLKRFENYRRSNEVKPSNNAWAWDMYKNYYEELTSKRQYGFEKLFWEVYSQAYDKALRDKQTEGNQ